MKWIFLKWARFATHSQRYGDFAEVVVRVALRRTGDLLEEFGEAARRLHLADARHFIANRFFWIVVPFVEKETHNTSNV